MAHNALSNEERSSWRTMPHKDQLIVLGLSRLAEPLTRTSFGTYIYYQIQSWDPTLSSAGIVRQAAWLQTALTTMVMLVSLPISRLADSPRVGRKGVLLMNLGVLGTSTICFGFTRSFTQALMLRILEGTFSGGTVVVRTMIPEIVPGKKHRVKAFLMLPLAFNVGSLIGPPIAGLLVEYARSHAAENEFLARWTYAPPMLMTGIVILLSFLAVFFLLEETLPALADQSDAGIRIKKTIVNLWHSERPRKMGKVHYEAWDARASDESQDLDPLLPEGDSGEAQDGTAAAAPDNAAKPLHSGKIPLRKALTANVLLATSCQAILDGLTAAYNTLWPLFLSDPPSSTDIGLLSGEGAPSAPSPLRFSGGAGLKPSQIALTLMILAVAALPLQIFVYPCVSYKLKPIGTLRCFLWCLALAFAITPLIAVTVKTPFFMWLIIVAVQLLMVLTAAMVVPSATLMTNNSAPSPAALAATHGLSVTLSAMARTICPLAAGHVYAASQAHQNGGLAWWLMAGIATCVCAMSWFLRDGTEQNAKAWPVEEDAPSR
ncbi:major facilitator superfamily transporter [Colletotrichum graminicola M1.001]|uniref:Major facilitator superfamily transporter n=1 Tax=Colletotrichum graminicola (strain M1.001 / M2 / FGSC 10212) TaxID=645133 RepID=E3R0S7_COLGM|nr:major facilitator superfamily transporter [Colletotrichum graminicola M1.001]EFQ36715.1 major facilitator superfamily transporter [Colletotrichum graminicola M1.001]